MQGGKNKNLFGYTIIEVMVVLAVSGVMFLIAAQFINGKQEHAGFLVGTNQLASQIQDIIEQVQDGKYSDLPIACTSTSPTSLSISSGSNTSSTQGTNNQCIFVGKFIHFGVNGQANKFEVFTIVASSQNASNAINVSNVWPVTPSTTGGGVELTINYNVPQGINIIGVRPYSQTNPSTPGIGIIQSLSSPGIGNGGVTGAQSYKPVWAPKLIPNQGEGGAASEIAGGLQVANQIYICVSDGTLYADILIGTDVSGNSTNAIIASVQQLGTKVCS